MPDCSEYPIAASIPESGTPITTSASTLLSSASSAPALFRASCTDVPSTIESGLEKYMYSNEQSDFSFFSVCISMLRSPFSSITTISPGSTSLMNFAPTASNAQVSEAITYISLVLPITSGLNPLGSLTPINFLGDIATIEYAPSKVFIASAMAASIESVLSLSFMNMDAIISLSLTEWNMRPFISRSLRSSSAFIIALLVASAIDPFL